MNAPCAFLRGSRIRSMVLRDEELPEALGDFRIETALGLAIILEWKA